MRPGSPDRKASLGIRVPDAPAGPGPAAKEQLGSRSMDGGKARAASANKDSDRPVGEALAKAGRAGTARGADSGQTGSPVAVAAAAASGATSAKAASGATSAKAAGGSGEASKKGGTVALKKTNSALFYLSVL